MKDRPAGDRTSVMQALLDHGINAFGAQLLVESYAQRRDANGVRRNLDPLPPPIHFELDGVVVSLAPRLERATEREPQAALWAVARFTLDRLAREHGVTVVCAMTNAQERAREPHAELVERLVADVRRALEQLPPPGETQSLGEIPLVRAGGAR